MVELVARPNVYGLGISLTSERRTIDGNFYTNQP
jgi:hypothetical protein